MELKQCGLKTALCFMIGLGFGWSLVCECNFFKIHAMPLTPCSAIRWLLIRARDARPSDILWSRPAQCSNRPVNWIFFLRPFDLG